MIGGTPGNISAQSRPRKRVPLACHEEPIACPRLANNTLKRTNGEFLAKTGIRGAVAASLAVVHVLELHCSAPITK